MCTSWVTVFNEQAEVMFSEKSADYLYNKLINDPAGKDEYDSTFASVSFTDWIIKCKVKQEEVGEEQRIKTSISSLAPLDYIVESCNLLNVLCA